MAKAIVKVSTGLIAEVLKMPEGMLIRDIQHDTTRGVLNIIVEHPNIPETKQGDSLPHISAIYTYDSGRVAAVVTADWGEWFTSTLERHIT